MKLNISNLIEAIYLNSFTLGQNIELQIMAAGLHLSVYLLFTINLSPFKLFYAKSSLLSGFRQTYRFEIPRQKHTSLSLKKKKEKRKKKYFNFT